MASPARTGRAARPLRRRVEVFGVVLVAFVAADLVAGATLAFLAGDLFTVFFFASFALAGSFIVVRRPRTVIGWLLLATGWTMCLASLIVPAGLPVLEGSPGLTIGTLALWGSGWGWAGAFGSLLALSILFPSGGLPMRPWRMPASAMLLLTAFIVVGTAFAPTLGVTSQGADVRVPNPLALLPNLAVWRLFDTDLLVYVLGAELIIGAGAMVIRYRRSTGQERLQLRWLVAALGFVVVGLAAGLALFPLLGGFAWLPVVIGYPLIPAAVAIAVLRYRLYEIDLLINRTALYGAVSLALAAGFGGLNVAVQRLLESWTGQRADIVTAALAVGAALSFAPLSRRLRPIADRLLPGRAVVALFFMDIVDSTRKAVELGDEAWRDRLGDYRSVVRRELSRFGGHEVDTAGDGFFATFEQAAAAVLCAVSVRAKVRRLDLEVRIGLHVGECEMRGEKVSGVQVHAAARVMGEAAAGEILLSESLRAEVSPDEFASDDRGRHLLKGIPGEWHLYALEPVVAS